MANSCNCACVQQSSHKSIYDSKLCGRSTALSLPPAASTPHHARPVVPNGSGASTPQMFWIAKKHAAASQWSSTPFEMSGEYIRAATRPGRWVMFLAWRLMLSLLIVLQRILQSRPRGLWSVDAAATATEAGTYTPAFCAVTTLVYHP